MRPAAAPGIKATKIDFRKSLLETPAINERAKQLLLGHIEGSAWGAAPSSSNDPSTAGVATHIHGVRPMWLSAYVIAHDSRHRCQIAIFARQRRECGFGK